MSPFSALSDPSQSGTSQDPTNHRVLCWFLLTLAVIVTFASFVYQNLLGLLDQDRRVAQTYQILASLQEATTLVHEVESARNAYILTAAPANLANSRAAAERVSLVLAELSSQFVGDPKQRERLSQLVARIDSRLKHGEAVLDSFEHDGRDAAREVLSRQQADDKNSFLGLVRLIEAEEQRLLQARRESTEVAARATLTIGGSCVAISLAVLAILFGVVRQELGRRRQAEASSLRANSQLEASLDNLRDLAEESARVATVGDYLQVCKSPTEAYAVLARNIPDLLPNVGGAVAIISHSRTMVETVLSWGEIQPFAPTFHPDECWGLRRGRPHHVRDSRDPECPHAAAGSSGTICLPMVVHGETLGVLSLVTGRCGELTEREWRVARTIADQMSLALANLRLQEALRDQSIRDPLTGLFNRRYLEETLGREVNRARRFNQPVSVVMVDVDHFKRFNDTHGHEAGDLVLMEVGRQLSRFARREDIACRYGGEEFCLILPGADRDTAVRRADEIRESLGRLSVQLKTRTLGPITISAGVAAFPTHPEDRLVAAADAALYQAKRAGRDRVVAAEPPTEQGREQSSPTTHMALLALLPSPQNGASHDH